MHKQRPIVAFGTFPDLETAQTIAKVLVEERLAACVNLFPGVQSVYRWNERVESAMEVACWIKTTEARYPELEQRYQLLHPYQVPALVVIDVQRGIPPYLDWIVESSKPES